MNKPLYAYLEIAEDASDTEKAYAKSQADSFSELINKDHLYSDDLMNIIHASANAVMMDITVHSTKAKSILKL